MNKKRISMAVHLLPILFFLLFLSRADLRGLIRQAGWWLQSRQIGYNCQDYLTYRSPYAILHYTGEDEAYVPMLAGAIDLYYPLLAKDFGLAPVQVSVFLHPDETAMQKNTGGRFRKAPMGAYAAGAVHLLSPRLLSAEADEWESKSRYMESGPVVHELTHRLMDEKTKGHYDIWLSEGIALYYEKKYTAFEWRPELKEKSRDIPLSRLKKEFALLDEGLAYRRAYDLVNRMADDYGEAALQALLTHLGEGKRLTYIAGEFSK